MRQITSLFAWKVVREVDDPARRSDLLRSVGIDPERTIDPAQMIPDEEYYRLFERSAAADSDYARDVAATESWSATA